MLKRFDALVTLKLSCFVWYSVEEIFSDLEAMTLAIGEAKKGLTTVSPNPPVGCVILDRQNRFVASGYHSKAGQDHAEIVALKNVKDPKQLERARFFVTLEPCAHVGRTPSCAKTLSELPIAGVVYGLRDPNPLVQGKGAEILKAVGKSAIEFDDLKTELEDLCEIFLCNMRQKKTFIALKIATSLDGKIGFQNGESQWITGEPARRKSRELRALYQAVGVGKKTFLNDDPQLDLRGTSFADQSNTVVIFDPRGETLDRLAQSRVVQLRNDPKKVIVIVNEGLNLESEFATLIECPFKKDLDLESLRSILYQKGITSMFVEGGAYTLSQFLNQKSASRLYQFIGPVILGSLATTSWTETFATSSMEGRLNLKHVHWELVGNDILMTGRIQIS